MNRIGRAAAILAVGVVAAARLTGAAPAAPLAPAPPTLAPPAQVDVVVRTSLITSPEHLKAYKADMLKRAAKCFGGLVAAVPG
ncbi:MAG: hypothetical protein IMZ66_08215, partial [Planctomycetes bacterium]|nr:hypothetical protein [Planctomycetota bacterium]